MNAANQPMASPAIRQRRHALEGGSLRAAVFGANDGLVSNASLILGMVGAGAAQDTVLTAGVAGLLAGALSMAAGEYVSMRSQREYFESRIARARADLEECPKSEIEALALIYAARGIAPAEARRLAAQLVAHPEHGLDVLAREVLGLNPDDLGSPPRAAAASFLAFASGASVPLVPFLLGIGLPEAAFAGVGLSALGLFAAGAVVGRLSGRHPLRGGLRMLLIGGGAGALAFGIGTLLGGVIG
jgi:VIT1/CCC1 family predicted Fe2+/Mn2+ transporter